MKNNSIYLSKALVIIALAFVSLNAGCGLISKFIGGPKVKEESITVAPGFDEYSNDKTYNALLTQPIKYKKITIEESEGKLAPYNSVFKESAEILAVSRQMKFGLNKIKSGEVKMSVKIDPSMISGGPTGIAEKANQIVNIDPQTKFGFKTIQALLKEKDEMKKRVEGLTNKIANLKPQDDLQGKEALAVGDVTDGIKQSQANLSTALSELQESANALASLAK